MFKVPSTGGFAGSAVVESLPSSAGIPGWGTRSHMHAAAKSSHATTKAAACCN